MNNNFNGKHLSLEDRKKIEEGIEKGLRKFEIAKWIGYNKLDKKEKDMLK